MKPTLSPVIIVSHNWLYAIRWTNDDTVLYGEDSAQILQIYAIRWTNDDTVLYGEDSAQILQIVIVKMVNNVTDST